MNINKLVIIILGMYLIPVYNNVFAQTPKYLIGYYDKPEPERTNGFVSSIKIGDSTQFMVVLEGEKRTHFTIYNMTNMEKQNSFFNDDPEVNGENLDNVQWHFGNNKLICIYSKYNKKTHEKTINGKILSTTGESIVAEHKLTAISSDQKDIGTIQTIFSPDKSKILILHDPKGGKHQTDELGFYLFSENLETLIEKKIKLPYKNSQFFHREIQVTNTGQIIILLHWEPSSDEIKKDLNLKGSALFRIFNINKETTETEELNFTEKGHLFSFVSSKIDPKTGNILFSGIYRDDPRGGDLYWANSVFHIELNPKNFSIEKKNFSKIDKNMLSQILKGKVDSGDINKKKENSWIMNKIMANMNKSIDKSIAKGEGMGGYKCIGSYFNDSGLLTLILESQDTKMKRERERLTGREIWEYTYYHYSILELTIGPSGTVQQSTIIPKLQSGKEPDNNYNAPTYIFNSFVSIVLNNKMFHIYNDAGDNFDDTSLTKGSTGKQFNSFFDGNMKKSLLVYASAGIGGKDRLLKTAFVNDRKLNIGIRPMFVNRVNESTVITWGFRNIPQGKSSIILKLYLE